MRPIPIPTGYADAIHPEAFTKVLGAPITGDLNDPEVSALEVVWHPTVLRGERLTAARSLWLPDDNERLALAGEALIALTITLPAHPPISIHVEDIPNANH